MNRPTSVTVVAWIIIALAIEGIVGVLSRFTHAALASVMDSSIPISIALYVGALFQLAAILFAALMLKGAGWARVAYVVLAVFLVIAMIPQVIGHSALIPVFVLTIAQTAVFLFFLFRADANAYFSGRYPLVIENGETVPPQEGAG